MNLKRSQSVSYARLTFTRNECICLTKNKYYFAGLLDLIDFMICVRAFTRTDRIERFFFFFIFVRTFRL